MTFDMKFKEWTMGPLDGEQSATEVSSVDLCKPSGYDINEIVVLRGQRPFDCSRLG